MAWAIPGLIVGLFAGWGFTYLYFHRDKIRKQIAADVQKAAQKVSNVKI